jgi:hypothetical protein
MKKNILLFMTFWMLFICSSAAANLYWVATTSSNWNNTANWSTSSGGSSCSCIPGEWDRVFFDNNGNGNCIVNANILVTSISINGYTGTITQGSYTLTSKSSGYFIQNSGTFTGGSGTITFESIVTISGGTFSGGSGNIDINNTFTISGGTFNAPSGNLYLSGNWTHTSGGTFNHNSGTVIFDNNNGYFDVATSETFNNCMLNKSTSSYYLDVATDDIIIVTGTLTISSGYFNVHGSSYLDARGNVSIGTMPYNNQMPLKFTGSANQTLTLTSSYNQFDADITINKNTGYSVTLNSNFILDHSNQDLTITSGTLDLNGNTLTVSGSGGAFTVTSSGTLQLQGGEACSTPTLNSGSTVTYDGTSGPYTMKDWSYKNLVINGGASSTFNLPDNKTIDGDLTITQGILDATTSDYDLTINGDWSNSGTFTSQAATVTFNTSGNQNIIGTTTFYDLSCNSTDLHVQGPTTVSNTLTINSSKVLTVDATKSLTASGTLTNSGGTSGLVLKSDASGTASLITGSSVSGTAERYLPVSTSAIYHYLSSPLASGTINNILDASFGDYNAYKYDPSLGGGIDTRWTRVFSSTVMTPGIGYIIPYSHASTTSKTISYASTLNTGDYTTVPISTSNSDWNLLGNPYPCAISASSFITENVTTNANFLQGNLAFWNQTSNFNTGDYAHYTLSGGTRSTNEATVPDGNIGTGQAFFVESGASASGGVCHFHNSMKTTTNTQFFVPDPDPIQRFYLNVTDEEDNFNQILIAFLAEATKEFDPLYDGRKLQGNPYLSFYSFINNDDDKYIIQGLPLLDESHSIPLGLYAGIGGDYTIELDTLENFEEQNTIYLEDKLTQKMIDLKKNQKYLFHAKKGEANDRFVLHFNPQTSNIKAAVLKSPIQVFTDGKLIHVLNPENKLLRVEIYDILGKNVFSTNIHHESQDILLNNNTGYYVVNVFDGFYSYQEKVFLSGKL